MIKIIDASLIKKLLLKVLNQDEILNLTKDKKVYFIHANNPQTPYIEYGVINSYPSEYSEGTIDFMTYKVQIDIFTSVDDPNYGDYTNLETLIIKKMIEEGFELEPGSPDLYEGKTKLYHKPLRFSVDLQTS